MGRGFSPDRYVTELFPEASYCASGLDAGKWFTNHFKFDFKHAFYTEIESGETTFVNGRLWKQELETLKEKSKKLEDKVIV